MLTQLFLAKSIKFRSILKNTGKYPQALYDDIDLSFYENVFITMHKASSHLKPSVFVSLFVMILFVNFAHAADTSLTILHTNDWQSRLLGFGPNSDFTPQSINDDTTRGGISRLSSLINQIRTERGDDNVLLLDGGDYSMGTLFHTIIRETGSELQLMSFLKYDAITFGNHEFDYRPSGLAQSIQSALRLYGSLPPIVISNMNFSEEDAADDQLHDLWKQGIIKPYITLNRGGKKIGIIGLMGSNAADVAPNAAPLTFSDPIETARNIVKKLRESEHVDLVIALSHGGILKDDSAELKWRSDDVDLLTEVTGIDIIIGGHSHTPLEQPIVQDGRMILQAGSEVQYLGELNLHPNQQKATYQLHPINDQISGDSRIDNMVAGFQQQVTKQFLQHTPYVFDQIIAQSHSYLSRKHDDNVLSNLVTDSMRLATQSDIALTANGSIRDDVYLGSNGIQRVSDLFRVVPLGIGVNDSTSGHDLVKVWVTAKEIKNMIEVLLLGYQQRGSSYFPRFSGFKVEYNSHRIPFDQISHIRLGNSKDGYTEIDSSSDNSHLYSLAINSYVGSLVWLVNDLSYGLFEIIPKNENGQPISSLGEAVFDSDEHTPKIQSLKEWQAFFLHIKKLPDLNGDGVADLPDYAESRLILNDSYTLTGLYRSATWIMYVATAFLVLMLFVVFIVIRKIFTYRQH